MDSFSPVNLGNPSHYYRCLWVRRPLADDRVPLDVLRLPRVGRRLVAARLGRPLKGLVVLLEAGMRRPLRPSAGAMPPTSRCTAGATLVVAAGWTGVGSASAAGVADSQKFSSADLILLVASK